MTSTEFPNELRQAQGFVKQVTFHGSYKVQRWYLNGKPGKITAIQQGIPYGHIVSLGQKVTSNGRYGHKKGVWGIVVLLEMPFEHGQTSDVIKVWFEGEEDATRMKFKDLDNLPTGSLDDVDPKLGNF